MRINGRIIFLRRCVLFIFRVFWFPHYPFFCKILLNCFHCTLIKAIFQFLCHQFTVCIDNDSRNRITIFIVFHKIKYLILDFPYIDRMPKTVMLLNPNSGSIQRYSGIFSFMVHLHFMLTLWDKVRQFCKSHTVHIIRLCPASVCQDNYITDRK